MKRILLVLLYIYCVEALYNETIETKAEAAGIPKGEFNLQKFTVSKNKIMPNFVFWWTQEMRLIYTDKMTDTSFNLVYDTANKENNQYFETISGEALAFQIPVLYNKRKDLIASANNIRLITYSANDRKNFTVSTPIITLTDQGFSIGRAHADRNGILYFLYSYNLRVHDPKKGSRLYRIQNQTAEKVHTFETKVKDFVFSMNYSQVYFITHNKKCVDVYDIDSKTGLLSNQKLYFNASSISQQTGVDMKLKSIELDRFGSLYLASGPNILRVSPDTKEVNKIMQLPEETTAITFGGYKDRNIIVSTKKGCNHNQLQGGAAFLISGLAENVGRGDQLARW